jgi:hypothetical protein
VISGARHYQQEGEGRDGHPDSLTNRAGSPFDNERRVATGSPHEIIQPEERACNHRLSMLNVASPKRLDEKSPIDLRAQ